MLLLYSLPSHAEEAPQAVKEYNIELLVFENLIDNDGGEIWPVNYSDWPEAITDAELDSDIEPEEIAWIGKERFQLNAEYFSLRNSKEYRPLLHIAWHQPVYDRKLAKLIQLPDNNNKDSGNSYVDGSVRVAVERYLHLYLDLQLHLPLLNASDFDDPETIEFEQPELRLKEHRRMRSKEVHYFDHPHFGVIALITAYQAPPEGQIPDEQVTQQSSQ